MLWHRCHVRLLVKLLGKRKGTSSVLRVCREASKPLPKPKWECSDCQRERGKEGKQCEWKSFLAGAPDDPEINCWRDPEGCTPCFKCMKYTWSGLWAEKVPGDVICHFGVRRHRLQWRITIYTIQYASRNSGASKVPWCSAYTDDDLPVNFTPVLLWAGRTARIWFAGRVDDFQQSLPSCSCKVVPCNLVMPHSHQGELVSENGKDGLAVINPMVWLPSGFNHQLDKYTLKYS